MVEVKFMGYDDRKKMKLSRKVLLPRPERTERKEGDGERRENRDSRPPRNDRRDDRRDGGDRRQGGNNRPGNDRPQHSGRTEERPAGEDTFKPLNESENTDDVKPEGF